MAIKNPVIMEYFKQIRKQTINMKTGVQKFCLASIEDIIKSAAAVLHLYKGL
jgi:hypothetical protein